MKSSTVAILALGVLGYFVLMDKRPTVVVGSTTPVGGQQAAQPDTFNNILGTITSLFNAAGSVAQATSKTT